MENNKNKRTGTERLYRGWHTYYGTLLFLCLPFGLLGVSGVGYLFILGFIPQGIFQVALGVVALLRPEEFKLRKKWLLYTWAILSAFDLFVFYTLENGYLDFIDLDFVWLLVLTILLPIIQFIALTHKSFKYEYSTR